MKCPRCEQANPPGSKFCLERGARLSARCPSCRAEVPGGAKFCNECGQALTTAASATPVARFASPETYTPRHLAEKILTSKSALEGERKQVTVLFADLEGSMAHLVDRDPEDARNLLDPVLQIRKSNDRRFVVASGWARSSLSTSYNTTGQRRNRSPAEGHARNLV
jgi:predicted amidophosphoribosyltransferase